MNPMDFLKNFQNVQSKMNEIQGKMKTIRVTGSAGGDMVQIELDGQLTVTKVTISPEAVEPENSGMLEDLVLAAFTDASVKIKEALRNEVSDLTGGMNFPPGFMGM